MTFFNRGFAHFTFNFEACSAGVSNVNPQNKYLDMVDKIKKLEKVINDNASTPSEKQNAKNLIKKIKLRLEGLQSD
jgi:hypothetical protein